MGRRPTSGAFLGTSKTEESKTWLKLPSKRESSLPDPSPAGPQAKPSAASPRLKATSKALLGQLWEPPPQRESESPRKQVTGRGATESSLSADFGHPLYFPHPPRVPHSQSHLEGQRALGSFPKQGGKRKKRKKLQEWCGRASRGKVSIPQEGKVRSQTGQRELFPRLEGLTVREESSVHK